MSGVAASRSLRRTALAIGLCLLAFSFAMETKLACYSPADGSASDIVAARALPAALPEVVPHGVHSSDIVLSQLLVVFLSVLTAAFLWMEGTMQSRNVAYRQLLVSSAAYFSPNLFFRPPPVR